VEAHCNKCELPSNHFLYCILLLFYFGYSIPHFFT